MSSPQSVEGERLLNQHFNQLIREAESTVDAFGREFGSRDISTLAEGELEAFADRYTPTTSLSPEFEDFLGKWAKKLAKGVTKLAKKAGQVAAEDRARPDSEQDQGPRQASAGQGPAVGHWQAARVGSPCGPAAGRADLRAQA